MAVSCPNAGEMHLIMMPLTKYQPIIKAGPSQPTSSASFFEKRMMSSTGFVTFKYRPDKA